MVLDQYTLDHYLKTEETLDDRAEFHDGLILPVEAATPTHARLGSRLASVLARAFPSCAVYDSTLNLYIASANRVLHPDATVICGPVNSPKPDCVDNPTILVEITSPSTKDYDHGTKREHYFTLPTLQHYLLVSQTERKIGHYQRSGAARIDKTWIDETRIYSDRPSGAALFLSDIELPVDAIYSDILP